MKLKSTPFLLLLPLLPLLFLSGCASDVKKVDYNEAIYVPEHATPAPIMFRGAEFLIPPGQDIGFAGESGACAINQRPVNRNAIRRVIDKRYLEETFRDTLESVGYDVVGGLDLSYVQEDEYQRAEYTIAAKIKGTQVDLCEITPDKIIPLFSRRSGMTGELYLSIDWSIYDPIKRTLVYKTTTEGYTKQRTPTEEGLTVMVNDAFEMAAHNLGADEQFQNLLVNGLKPTHWKGKRAQNEEDNYESRRQFNPLAAVSIEQNALSHTPFTQNIEHKRKHAVMIQKIGHGSGFFITKQGHILTNAHVVGDAIRMRVVTAGRKQKLSAEVLRVDKARDVALLRLEEIPASLDIVTLPIRTQIPNIGEPVYVLGTPQHHAKLQDTLTHGVVSAYRENFKLHGISADFIQSDAEVHGGNSGGPMYDQFGNVIGMSALAINASNGNIGNGLNLFIPIGDALNALDISIGKNTSPARITSKETENFGHSDLYPNENLNQHEDNQR